MNKHPLTYSGFEPPYAPQKWKSHPGALETHNCYTYMLNDLEADERNGHKPQPGEYAARTNKHLQKIISKISRLDCGVQQSVILDNANVKIIPLSKGEKYKCKKNHYKGFLMISPQRDYHFARQDNRMVPVYREIEKQIRQGKLIFPKDPKKIQKLFNSLCDKKIPEIVKLSGSTPGQNSRKRLANILKFSKIWSHKPGSSYVTDKDGNGNYILNPSEASWDFSRKSGINYSVNCCYFEIPTNSFAQTRSTGVQGFKVNSPHDVRKDLGINTLDSKYEKLVESLTNPNKSMKFIIKSLAFAHANNIRSKTNHKMAASGKVLTSRK